MDFVRRLIACFALFFSCGAAMASFPVPAGAGYDVSGRGHYPQSSVAAVCNALNVEFGPGEYLYPLINTVSNADGTGLCYFQHNFVYTITPTAGSCPANSTGGATCTCNAGYAQSGSSCIVQPTCTAGKSVGRWSQPDLQACSAGCVVQAITSVGPTNVSRTLMVQTGAKCDGSETNVQPDTATGTGSCPGGADVCPPTNGSCPKGTYADEVAGQAVCVGIPKSAASPASGASTPENAGTCPGGASICAPTNGSCPSGTSAEEVAGNVVCIAIPSTSGKTSSETTTTTKTTTNPDGSTTTTTSSTGTESKPNDIASFCKENQGAAICGDKGSWAGSCAGGFTCGGDAVQCAQAQAAWKTNCALQVDSSNATVQLGQSAISAGVGHFAPGTDPNAGGDNTVNVSSQFDQTNPYFSACPADKTITVLGQSVVMPFGRLCPYLQIMGYLAVSFSLLAGAKIALGGS